ncbi:MAG: hypothetical protein IPN36_08200 [Bacteroidetes bacterium]|nr:hypothetical protein [Bacteroidota bacterium]
MFPFQNLEVYKKSKLFHLHCKEIILTRKLDSYVRDQLGRASFSVPLNIAEVRTGRDLSPSWNVLSPVMFPVVSSVCSDRSRPVTCDVPGRIVGM